MLALVAVGGLAFFIDVARINAADGSKVPTRENRPAAAEAVAVTAWKPRQSGPTQPVDQSRLPLTKPTRQAGNRPPAAREAAARPQLNDDRYVVVRNRTLKTDDASGKNKNQNLHGVLANDGLPTGKSYEVECVDKPKFGELKLNRDGTFTYASAAGREASWFVPTRFKYRVRAVESRSLERAGRRDHCDSPLLRRRGEAAMKHIAATYGDATIRTEPNPPAVRIDFSEPNVHKRIRDESLNVLDRARRSCCAKSASTRSRSPTARSNISHALATCGFCLWPEQMFPTPALAKILAFKNLSEVDLSDTLVTEAAVAALAADRGKKVPLRVVRDGPIDRLRSAGVAIAGQERRDARSKRFCRDDSSRGSDFKRSSPLLKEAPRLVGIVLSNSDVSDELVTENLVRQLKFLKAMDLRGTIVSPQHVALLRKAISRSANASGILR